MSGEPLKWAPWHVVAVDTVDGDIHRADVYAFNAESASFEAALKLHRDCKGKRRWMVSATEVGHTWPERG